MYVAYDSKDEVFNALDKDIEKNKEYHCPICGGKVIFKKGMKIQSHFAHAKNCSCEFETYFSPTYRTVLLLIFFYIAIQCIKNFIFIIVCHVHNVSPLFFCTTLTNYF